MDKISGILPSSARVKSVDVSEAHPVRPGVPSMGRPVGRDSIQDRVTFNARVQEAGQNTLTYKNPKEDASAKIAEEVNRRFFGSRLEGKEPLSAQVQDSQAEALEISSEPRENRTIAKPDPLTTRLEVA